MPFSMEMFSAQNIGRTIHSVTGGEGPPNHARRFVVKLAGAGSTAAIGRIKAELTAANVRVEETDYHADRVAGRIFIRMILHDLSGVAELAALRSRLTRIAVGLGPDSVFQIRESHSRAKVVVLVSSETHCLLDILRRTDDGTLPATVVAVVGNHETSAGALDGQDVPFHHVKFPARDARDRTALRAVAFEQIGQIVDDYQPDVIVLARFMQILPADLCSRWAGRAINIHHSILPSFAGASPYRQAHLRGVKVVGATCHYVTHDLDAGPIIEQDVIRVNHADTVADMISKGRDVECAVLRRGLKWHLDSRVFISGDNTVVLEPDASNRMRSA